MGKWLGILLVTSTCTHAGNDVTSGHKMSEGHVPPPAVKDKWPKPPAQEKAWNGQGPHQLLSLSEALFRYGFADPRQLEYREITVRVGNVWGQDEKQTTAGWVFANGTLAIAWTGLIYPVEKVGALADVAADVDKILAQHKSGNSQSFMRNEESKRIDRQTLHPLRAVLLLRLGKEKLATKLWETWVSSRRQSYASEAVEVVQQFASALYERAVTRHMYGEDVVTLRDAHQLIAAMPRMESDTRKLGARVQDGKVLWMRFLDNVRVLHDDAAVRVGTRTKPVGATEKKFRALENITERQMSQPGGVDLRHAPAIKAVVALGDTAMPRLIEVLGDDQRLTRSVSFHRDFSSYRHLISVAEAAYVAILEITGHPGFDDAWRSMQIKTGRQALAREIHQYWSKHQGQNKQQRWLALLADDTQTPDIWIDAAKQLTGYRSGALGGAKLAVNLQVTKLIINRLKSLNVMTGKAGKGRPYLRKSLFAGEMGMILAQYDPVGSRAAVLAQIARNKQLVMSLTDETDTEYLALATAQHVEQLTHSGEKTALADYYQWLMTVDKWRLSTNIGHALAPLWKFKSKVASKQFAQWLTADASPYTPLLGDGSQRNYHIPLSAQMLTVTAVRKRVAQELSQQQKVGTFRVDKGGAMALTTRYVNSSFYVGKGLPGYAQKVGQTFDARYCDALAHQVTYGRNGVPSFQLFWDQGKRDAAIADLRRHFGR